MPQGKLSSQDPELFSQRAPATGKQDGQYEDCTPCRFMGGITFIGLGLYCMTVTPDEMAPDTPGKLKALAKIAAMSHRFERSRAGAQVFKLARRAQPKMPVAIGTVFVGMGLWRLFR
ncbi:MAG: hypothetical protein M1831_004952 [Alyxoria varia]|nr:MAG: hypothetical protein M1831_004952 [Alyxoria varia]